MLSIDDYWVNKQLWLTSSFNKMGRYFRVYMLLLKAWFLILFMFFRFNMELQSALMTVTIALFGAYFCVGILADWRVNLPFRNMVSNLILICASAMMTINSTFGMFNAFGVENAITVGSTEFYFIAAANFVGLLAIGALLVYQGVACMVVLDWPSVHTLNRIWHNEDLVTKAAMWVQTIRESFVVRADFILAPAEVADVLALEESIRVLRGCWLAARSCGSLFEVPLSEALEELLFLHSTRYPDALRKHPYWNNVYIQPEVRASLQQRYYDHSMMAPKKRRVLFKLLAIRYMKGDRGEFSMDVALKQARLDKAEREERERHEAQIASLLERKKQLKKSSSGKNKNKNKTKQGYGFSAFSHNAQFLLFGASTKGGEEVEEGKSEKDKLLQMEQGQLGESDKKKKGKSGKSELGGFEGDEEGGEGEEEEGEGYDVDENGMRRFPAQDVEEAAKMIARLIERTELALNKHHNAKINMIAQENKSLAEAIALNSSSVALTAALNSGGGGGLAKISTMELIKETVDKEEQNDLEELYFLWDEAIQLYELEEFPGDYELLNRAAENWYTYRGLVTQRLEVVARTLHERDYESLLEGQEVIEEGEESDEEEEEEGDDDIGNAYAKKSTTGRISPRLQQLQELSTRTLSKAQQMLMKM